MLTALGIPMLFMGQEILEDKYWSDSPDYFADSLIWWDGLSVDRRMRDHLRFVQDLIGLRRNYRALTSESIRVFHARVAGIFTRTTSQGLTVARYAEVVVFRVGRTAVLTVLESPLTSFDGPRDALLRTLATRLRRSGVRTQ